MKKRFAIGSQSVKSNSCVKIIIEGSVTIFDHLTKSPTRKCNFIKKEVFSRLKIFLKINFPLKKGDALPDRTSVLLHRKNFPIGSRMKKQGRHEYFDFWWIRQVTSWVDNKFLCTDHKLTIKYFPEIYTKISLAEFNGWTNTSEGDKISGCKIVSARVAIVVHWENFSGQ